MHEDVVLLLTTVPVGEPGERIARALVDERLAACVNLYAPMTSVYRWKGGVETDVERQMIVKTTAEQLSRIKARVAELHAYELPELLVVPVIDGGEEYLNWVRSETT